MLHSSLVFQPVLAFLGTTELWVIGLIVLLLFGGKKLPGLARSMGASIDQFKRGLKDSQKEIDEAVDATRLEDPNEKQD